MKADIINTDYFKETKFYKVWQKAYLFSGICIGICFIIDQFFTSLDNYKNYYLFFQIFFAVLLLISVLGAVLFNRIGTIEVIDYIVVITNREGVDRIDLTTVNKVKIRKVEYRFYRLDINQHSVIIDFTRMEFEAFVKLLQKLNIKVDKRWF